ncbi:hypothetical protein [Streptomyces coelicoflavus]|uniref:hypothetical protein n=1 Tax=Streptomyces coelicoflavus TaxID=285562 RepID=UPI003F4A4FF7
MGQTGSHVRFVGGERGQSVDEIDQGAAGGTVLRPEPGLGRFVTELQRVTVDEERASEIGREAVHEGGRYSAQLGQDLDGQPRPERSQGLAQTVDLRAQVVGVFASVHHVLEEFVEEGAVGVLPRLPERDQTGLDVRGHTQNEGLDPRVAAGTPMELGRLCLRDRPEYRLKMLLGLGHAEALELDSVHVGRRFQQIDAFAAAQHHEPHVVRQRLAQHVRDEGPLPAVVRDERRVVSRVHDKNQERPGSGGRDSLRSAPDPGHERPRVVGRLSCAHRDQWIAKGMRSKLVRQLHQTLAMLMAR